MRECKYCDSNIIIKKGIKYNKQCFYCRGCKRYFTEGKDNRIKRNVRQKELAITLHLYDNSMRSVQHAINLLYDTKISISSIFKWIKSFKKSYTITKEQNEENRHKTMKILTINELHNLKENEWKDLKYGILLTEKGTKLIQFE